MATQPTEGPLYEVGHRRALARGVAVAMVASLGLAAYATVHQYRFTAPDDLGAYFAWQNAGRSMALVSLALLVALNSLQRGRFGWTRPRALAADERQERTLVFARAFELALLCVILAALLVFRAESWIAGRISQPVTVYPNPLDLHWLLVDFVVLIAALPNLIGAWRGDRQP